ncbi:hypothetical protein [Endozoicomonas sp. 8E]|uniref:hypothetical protein n=1 Tax=Endozoicomonas sp. 8E TaxID=3035692 RepID=UPI0029394BFE|nr:hypothetical protein [Endozoicomonas sp. 8E]WOG26915.1 hypothetical protein P6910_20555 [Endozoicomonas sp. 8E]
MHILSLSVVCQTGLYTGHHIVKFQKNTDSPNQSFSVKPDLNRFQGTSSVISHINGYTESDWPPDNKRQNSFSHKIKTNLIHSISWQLLSTIHLLFAYQLILTTKDASPGPAPLSWLPSELIIDVGWLLKGCWKPDLAIFNPMEQLNLIERQEASQDHTFTAITLMFSSGHSPQQYPPSASYGQQVPQVTTRTTGSFPSSQYSGSGSGGEDPEQHRHTLGLNCFIYPCHGFCQFRSSFDNRGSDEWPLNSVERSCPHLANGYCFSCMDRFDSENATHSRQSLSFGTLNDSTHRQHDSDHLSVPKDYDIDSNPANSCNPSESESKVGSKTTYPAVQQTCDVTVVGKYGQLNQYRKARKNAQNLLSHKRNIHSGQRTCFMTVVGEDGQQRSCGKVCRNAQSLSTHRSRYHSGQKTCGLTTYGEDGQQRPCGMICKNMQALIVHKNNCHTERKICNVTVVGKDGQKQPCGRVCSTAQSLWGHKSRYHTGQKTCEEIVVREDGQQKPCGKVCRNTQAQLDHKKNVHTGPKICDVTVNWKDGQQQPCRKVCKNVQALVDHKRKVHTRQQTCNMTVIGKNGLQQPCGKVSRNAMALSIHKSKFHSGQKTCEVTIVGEDDQPRPCRTVCKNASALSYHKIKVHSGQKVCHAMLVGKDDPQQPCGKMGRNTRALTDNKRAHRKRKPDST